MEIRITYEGKQYIRRNSKWVGTDNLVVPTHLQDTLNRMVAEEDLSPLSYEEIKAEGDRYKDSESFRLAVRYYEEALKKADSRRRVAALLPRITSCYRKLGLPQQVIHLLADMKEKYGEGIISPVLLTSVAAAFCDLGEPENALRCCRWGYKLQKDRGHEASMELSNVFTRAQKMIDPDYIPEDGWK